MDSAATILVTGLSLLEKAQSAIVGTSGVEIHVIGGNGETGTRSPSSAALPSTSMSQSVLNTS